MEACLVRHGGSWPGLRRAWPSKPRAIKRPSRFFRSPGEGGDWPEQAVLEFVRPPGYETLSDDELAGVIHAAVEQREQRFRTQYDAEGRPFLGRRRILEQSRHACPHNREPRFRLSPRIACRNKWRRIERLLANKRWLGGYRMALAAWSAGDREVEFPAGTYQMRVRHGVRCASGPD